jgi:integrase
MEPPPASPPGSARTPEVALATAMIVLCGGRKGEILSSTWGQFDLLRKVWSIPGNEMKEEEPHHVPLVTGMLEILSFMRERVGGHPLPTALVFPSSRNQGNRINDAAPQMLLKSYGLAESSTVHGFRSSLQDFIAENTAVSPEARQLMIAHSPGTGPIDKLYMRSQLTDERRLGFQAWSDWLAGRPIDPRIVKPASLADQRRRPAA